MTNVHAHLKSFFIMFITWRLFSEYTPGNDLRCRNGVKHTLNIKTILRIGPKSCTWIIADAPLDFWGGARYNCSSTEFVFSIVTNIFGVYSMWIDDNWWQCFQFVLKTSSSLGLNNSWKQTRLDPCYSLFFSIRQCFTLFSATQVFISKIFEPPQNQMLHPLRA